MVESFSAGAGLTGGLLIGLASAVLLLFNGNIAGISGILDGVLTPGATGRSWRIAFVQLFRLLPS